MSAASKGISLFVDLVGHTTRGLARQTFQVRGVTKPNEECFFLDSLLDGT